LRPAAETSVRRSARSVAFGDVPQGGAGADLSDDAIEEALVVVAGVPAGGWEKLAELLPFLAVQFMAADYTCMIGQVDSRLDHFEDSI